MNRFTKAWKTFWEPSQPIERKEFSGPWAFDDPAFINFVRGKTTDYFGDKTFVEVAQKAFEQNVVGYKCVNLVANGVGSLCWYLRDKRTGKEVEKHALLDLINRPNPLQGKGSFFAHAQGSKLLDGNLFIEMVGTDRDGVSRKAPPRELWVLRPDYVTVNMSTSRLPHSYTYTPSGMGSGTAKTYPVNQIDGSCQLIHTMSYSPLFESSMGRGLSPARSTWLSLLTHTEGQRWNLSLLENGARPSGAFVTGGAKEGLPDITQEQVDELKAQIAAMYQGSSNTGKPMVLAGGLDWKEMSLGPKDMDFIQSKNSSARDLALAFGVPPLLLNIPGDSTYSNYKEARMALYEDTILPAAYTLAGELNRALVPLFDDNLELCIDEDAISALEPKRELKWTRANTANFLTVNEKREMVGYEPIGPAGDEVLVPSSNLPLGASLDDSEVSE